MSRRFAGVGVDIGAARIREIATGAPAADTELTDVEFAVLASELRHERQGSKLEHGKRICMRWLLVTSMGLIMFGALLCATWLMLSLMLHTSPF